MNREKCMSNERGNIRNHPYLQRQKCTERISGKQREGGRGYDDDIV